MDVFEAIYGRRSIRKYRYELINEELIIKVLDAARWAPSSRNRQPWEFIVISDRRTLKSIAELAPYGRFISTAPLAIAVVVDPTVSPVFYKEDGSCAVQNLMLAAWALNLGTCWIGAMDREKVKELLHIPMNKYLLTVIPIGYPEEVPEPPPRKPLEEIVHVQKYGNLLKSVGTIYPEK